MTITVSISQFRQNMSDYIEKVRAGHTIVLKDEKRGDEVLTMTGKKSFDPDMYEKGLHSVAGTISVKDHPEWATPRKIRQWLIKTRKANERHF